MELANEYQQQLAMLLLVLGLAQMVMQIQEQPRPFVGTTLNNAGDLFAHDLQVRNIGIVVDLPHQLQ